METKNGVTFCDRIKEQAVMDMVFYVESIGIAGGLALWWRNEVMVQFINSNENMIDIEARFQQDGELAHITWVHTNSKDTEIGRH